MIDKVIALFLKWLVPFAITIFLVTGILKLINPLMAKFELVDVAVQNQMPDPLLMLGGLLELGVVVLLCKQSIGLERKMQLLFVFGVTLVGFRYLAFGQLFAEHCGCYGALPSLSRYLGKALERLAVVLLCSLVAGYPLYLVDEYIKRSRKSPVV